MGLCLQLPQLVVGCWESAARYRKWGQEGKSFSAALWECAVIQEQFLAPECLDEECLGGCCAFHHFLSRGFQCCAHPSPALRRFEEWHKAHLDSGIWKSGVPQSRHNELDLLVIEALSFFRFVITFGECQHKTYTFSQMTVLSYGVLLVLIPECLQRFLHEPQVLKVAGFTLQRHVMSCAHDRRPASLLSFVLTLICYSLEGCEHWGFSLYTMCHLSLQHPIMFVCSFMQWQEIVICIFKEFFGWKGERKHL